MASEASSPPSTEGPTTQEKLQAVAAQAGEATTKFIEREKRGAKVLAAEMKTGMKIASADAKIAAKATLKFLKNADNFVGFVASGAGVDEVNGEYERSGSHNLHKKYTNGHGVDMVWSKKTGQWIFKKDHKHFYHTPKQMKHPLTATWAAYDAKADDVHEAAVGTTAPTLKVVQYLMVQGAGCEQFNGQYHRCGHKHGKENYRNFQNDLEIWYSGTKWCIGANHKTLKGTEFKMAEISKAFKAFKMVPFYESAETDHDPISATWTCNAENKNATAPVPTVVAEFESEFKVGDAIKLINLDMKDLNGLTGVVKELNNPDEHHIEVKITDKGTDRLLRLPVVNVEKVE